MTVRDSTPRIHLKMQDAKTIEGGYYKPDVDENGILSWTPSKEHMPELPKSNIKGKPGYTPIKGVDYFDGAPGKDGTDANVTTENITRALGYTPADEGDVNQLKADLAGNAKYDAETRRKLDYLWKLNNGISYQFEADNAEAYSKTVPSGAKVAIVESIGGHTEEINDGLVSSEVESIVLYGKNMWNDADAQFNSNYFSWSGDSWISNRTGGTFIFINFLLDPGTYTISVSVDRIENEQLKMQFRDSSNTILKGLEGANTIGRYELTYAVSARGTYKVLIGGHVNGKITISNVQLEKNGKATKYSKYMVCTIAHIPDSVRTLPGYGWSAGDVWNAIERTETGWQYVQRVASREYQDGDTVTDGVITYYALDNPVITDITDLMADFPAYFEVEAGGIITMENAAMLPVPSTEKYLIALAEVNG